jgi:hypothetical protein
MDRRAESLDTPNNRNPKSTAAEIDSVVDGDDGEPDPLSTPASSLAAAQGSQAGIVCEPLESYIHYKMKMKISRAANTDNEPSEAIPGINKLPSTIFAVTLSRELAAAAIRLAGKSENTVMLNASGHQHCRGHFVGCYSSHVYSATAVPYCYNWCSK